MADHIQKEKMTFREIFISYGAVIALAVLIVFNGIVTKNFLSLNTLWLVIKQSTPILFMTVGMTFVISSGGIDISTGSMMAFCGIIVSLGITNGGNFWVWCLIGLAACAAIGVFNGFLISSVGVQPVILTLVMQIVMRGVTVLMAKSSVFVLGGYPEIKTLGIYRFPGRVPIQIVFFIFIVIVSVFVLRKTLLGKYVEAVGSNPKAARLTGVRTVAVIITVYVISAVLAGSCGILEMCRNAALDPNELGKLYELDAIAACVVGGISFTGGIGKISGVVVGVFIFTALTYSLTTLGIDTNLQFVFSGIIILVAVMLDCLKYVQKK